MIICLPQDIQDVGDFVSSVEHKQRFLTQTVAVCQSYNASQWAQNLGSKKKHAHKFKLNVAARDDTLDRKTQNDLFVREAEQDLYNFLPLIQAMSSSPKLIHNILRVNVLWHIDIYT